MCTLKGAGCEEIISSTQPNTVSFPDLQDFLTPFFLLAIKQTTIARSARRFFSRNIGEARESVMSMFNYYSSCHFLRCKCPKLLRLISRNLGLISLNERKMGRTSLSKSNLITAIGIPIKMIISKIQL